MGQIEIQAIVSNDKSLPFVQVRQFDDEGAPEGQWQLTPMEAREVGMKMIEASINSVYDAALVAWANETWPEDKRMGARMLMLVREYRSDIWGLPSNPEDWRLCEFESREDPPGSSNSVAWCITHQRVH